MLHGKLLKGCVIKADGAVCICVCENTKLLYSGCIKVLVGVRGVSHCNRFLGVVYKYFKKYICHAVTGIVNIGV